MSLFLRKMYLVVSVFGGIILAIVVGWFAGKAAYSGGFIGGLMTNIIGIGSGVLTFLLCIFQYGFVLEYNTRKSRRKVAPKGIKPTLEFITVYGNYLGVYRDLGKIVIVCPEYKQVRCEPFSFIRDWQVFEKTYNGKVDGYELTLYFNDYDFPVMRVEPDTEKEVHQFKYIMSN